MNTKPIILAALLALASCADARTEKTAEPSQPRAERMRFTVTDGRWEDEFILVPETGDSAVRVDADSLSKTIRPGETVRRCRHATNDARGYVTWCRDTKGSPSTER